MISSKDAIEQRTLIQTENRVCLPAKSFAHLFSLFFFLVIKKPYFHPGRTLKRREHFQLAPGNKQISTVQSYGMIWLTASVMECTLSCGCQSMGIRDSSHFLGRMNLGCFNFYFFKTILIIRNVCIYTHSHPSPTQTETLTWMKEFLHKELNMDPSMCLFIAVLRKYPNKLPTDI